MLDVNVEVAQYETADETKVVGIERSITVVRLPLLTDSNQSVKRRPQATLLSSAWRAGFVHASRRQHTHTHTSEPLGSEASQACTPDAIIGKNDTCIVCSAHRHACLETMDAA